MKAILERGDQYILVPDEAEPGDDDVTATVVTGDGQTSEHDLQSLLQRGYWEETDATADEVLGDDELDEKGSDTTTIRGLSDEALTFIKERFNVEVEE